MIREESNCWILNRSYALFIVTVLIAITNNLNTFILYSVRHKQFLLAFILKIIISEIRIQLLGFNGFDRRQVTS